MADGAGPVSHSRAVRKLMPAVAAAAVVPAAVLSAGLSAGAAPTPAVAPASAAAPRDALPVTGSESSTTMQIALALLLGGVGLVAVTGIRRRQRANAGITM